MNVLSLFDGISCSRVALDNLGIKVDNYFASEIDKHCINASKKNYPDIIHLGDINDINLNDFPGIDLLIGGSPCQDISHAFLGKGLEGSRSSLFHKFVAIKNKLNPKFFILENVKSKWKNEMDKAIGVCGIEMNSRKFSAQSRPRIYWSNLKFTEPKHDNFENIIDILQSNVDRKYFLKKEVQEKLSLHYQRRNSRSTKIEKIITANKDQIRDNERQRRIYSIYGKSPTILARSDTTKVLTKDGVRKLTPLECERLQCLPKNYTDCLSDTQRYKAIGNGFTVDAISHILQNINKSKDFK
jgi:DNA-cytosine methyltransferase